MEADVQSRIFSKDNDYAFEGAVFYYKCWAKSTKSCGLLPQNILD